MTEQQHACNRADPQPHPWRPIANTACGYDGRMTDKRCNGCCRQRPESALEQLQAMDKRHTENGLRK